MSGCKLSGSQVEIGVYRWAADDSFVFLGTIQGLLKGIVRGLSLSAVWVMVWVLWFLYVECRGNRK